MGREIVTLALRTHTLPSQWLSEDDKTIITALDVLKSEQSDGDDDGD